MEIKDIETQLSRYRNEKKQIFATSSFQTHSIVMLHIISRIDKSIPVYFLNTGFHFPETIIYKDLIAKKFGLNVLNLTSYIPKHMQKSPSGEMLFTSDPDYCCYINKVQTVEPLLQMMDIWINGVRADQGSIRKEFKTEEKTNFKAVRYHPMLNWTGKMIFDYIKEYDLPRHPLEQKGYFSIGCEPCTRKSTGDNLRDARWFGMSKTECGLNTELINKK
jgi:phosphoadenosine phosphosulfate reductase